MHVISITAWESLTRFSNYPRPAERNNHRVGGTGQLCHGCHRAVMVWIKPEKTP